MLGTTVLTLTGGQVALALVLLHGGLTAIDFSFKKVPASLAKAQQSASEDCSAQNSRCLGVLGNGMTSRILVTPVTAIKKRSNPRPNPACGTVPNRRASRYHQ